MVQQSDPVKLRLDARAFEAILARGGDQPLPAESPTPFLPAQTDGPIPQAISRQSQLNSQFLSAMALVQQQVKETRDQLAHIEARLGLSGSHAKQSRQDRRAVKLLGEQLKRLTDEVSSLKTTFDVLENTYSSTLSQRLAESESRQVTLEARLASFEARFEAAQAVWNIDQDRAAVAEKRLDAAEQSITAAQQDSYSARLLAEEVSHRVDAAGKGLAKLEQRIEALTKSDDL